MPSLRVEGGYPLRLRPLPGLALVVSVLLSYEHRNSALLGELTSVNLTPMAGAQYELVMPFAVPGRLAAFFELGIGPSISFLRFPGATGDEPRGDVFAVGALRIAAAGRWVLPLGLVIALQPLGVIFTTLGGLFYEASVTLGYRWR